MSNSQNTARRSVSRPGDEETDPAEEPGATAAWLAVVTEKVKSIRYGVVQIVVHDSKVVQIERTERTRFEVPQATGHR